jgi:hypothetical protein
MQPTVLISLSGGMDSAFVLWQQLHNHPEITVLVHHVNLRHPAEDRLIYEKQAVANILRWLRKNGYTNFIYHESNFEYGTLPRIMVKDIQIVAFFQAIILRTAQWDSIDTVKFCWHHGEVHDEEILRGTRIRKLFDALEVKQSIKFEFPIKDLNRKQMARLMPPDLLDMVSCCRKPHLRNGPCGSCKTCKELKAAQLPLR